MSHRTDDLCLYRDKDFKNSFVVENFGDVISGETAKKTGYICNNSDSTILQIDYSSNDPDVTLEDLPLILDSGEWKKIDVVYSPDKTRKTGLNTSVVLTGKKSELVNK